LYDEAATESVSFVVNSLKVEVKDGFEVSYSCNSKRVDPAEYPNTNTILNTAQKVAEAKCIVFEEKIKAAVATAIANLKAGKTKFDDVQSAFVI
jgi:hypothetical protein